MWKRTFSKTYPGLKKEVIWRLWTDVNNWAKWHGELDSCAMKGAFEVGNYFLLKPKGAREVKIVLTEVVHGKQFTDCTRFPGAKMVDTHAIEETPEGLRLTNTVTVTGPLKWLWIKLVAQHVADSASGKIEALVKLARNEDA